MAFQRIVEICWSDCDPNGHLRNSAYADLCTDVRFAFFGEQGFDVKALFARKIGPVVLHDETDYLKELRLGEKATIDLRALGMTKDGMRWKLGHRVFRPDGVLAARHELSGAWLDLERRKLCAPPLDVFEVMKRLERSDDYAEL